jgi:hemerythrin
MIQWKESYRIGVEEIDQQHQRLFEIANQAYDLLKNDLLTDKYDRIVRIIEELRDYTIYHFGYEENYMASIKYKKMLSHKVIHDDFIAKINEVNLDNVDENQDQYLTELLDFVVQWIEQHILGTDKLIVS